jgi:hypothetical protein
MQYLDELVYLAVPPPFYGIQAVAGLILAESGGGDSIQFETMTKNIDHFFHQIKALYLGKIARVIFIQNRDIEMVAIPGDQHVGLFHDRPQIFQLCFQEAPATVI